ncbi:error-prone DNA polymerase [Aliidiomarina sp. Khilg15.8]
MGFAELHCLSNFSFLRSASAAEELVEQAIAYEYEALAITDECSLAGVVKGWKAARGSGLKFIIGSEFHCPEHGCFVLLSRGQQGYRQLSAFISTCRGKSRKGEYDFAVTDLEQATLDDCLLLWRPASSLKGAPVAAHALKLKFKQRFWLLAERGLHGHDGESARQLGVISQQLDCPVVASNGACMHSMERLPLYHVLSAIRQHQPVSQIQSQLAVNGEQRLRSRSETEQLYPAAWIEQSLYIAEQCTFDLGTLRYEYPAEVVPSGKTPQGYLGELAAAGLQRRYPKGAPEAVAEQLQRELDLVAEMEYAHFFLTIYDIIDFAAQQRILFQGRGSAANSVLCYCLGITAVNPAQSDLLFERFISKERNEPPDIDVDFEHERREEVIQYIYHKYGRERAALTATVITYRLRSALRDVGKALGFPQAQLSQLLARLDRRDSEEDWHQQLQALGLLKHPMGQHLLDLTEQIRGFPRHLSQHVGGFVIASERLSDLVPVENASMPDRTVIQWDKNDIETLKLLKVDVLALGMLTALRKGFQLVEQHYGKALHIRTLPQEDPAVYAMLQKADAVGLFQVESRAQMNMLPRLKPKTFYDLVVQIAIVRPGPIQGDMVHPYLRRRDGLEPVEYPNDEVKAVLQRTLGVPIFQEQVIKLAMVAAGFSGGEADQLRRAMATWKSSGQMLEFKKRIVEGMRERGYEEEFALRLFAQICGFGEYGFPESHAASFANLAYASAWLKCHYPGPFYVGLLNSLPMGFYSAAQIVQDARRHGIAVDAVCINQSSWDHQLEAGSYRETIRLGLRLVKGLNKQAAQTILQQRPVTGFTSLAQVEATQVAGTELEALASAGALTSLAGHRYQARWDLTRIGQQLPLLATAEEASAYELSAPDAMSNMHEDYAAVGMTLGDHPIALLHKEGRLKNCKKSTDLPSLRHGQLVTVTGLVVGRQRPSTSSGVTFVTLEDETGNVNVVIWQETGRRQRQQWLHARLLEVKGTLEKHGEIIHVVAGRLTDKSTLLASTPVKSRDFH